MDIDNYWMWLSSLDLFNRKNINILLNYFYSPEEIWNASSNSLYAIKNLSENYIKRILDTRTNYNIDNKLYSLEKHGVKYISINNKCYPENLKNIVDCPYGIYLKGNLTQKKYVAIIGSRKCSDYGANVTKTFAKQLAQNNIVIVSGMAKGIDSLAHEGAICSNIKNSTVAVFGSGIDICYPKENSELMNKIIANGAIISEYPLGTNPHPAFFPQRNRIISGLSESIIVIEATKKSGSLITVDQALEQGREVFAVPGNITSQLSQGTNDLIKQGATLITDIDDILKELGLSENKYQKKPIEKHNTENLKSNNEDFLAPDEKLVYDCISLESQNIEIIFDKLDCPINKLQYILTLLELKGYIQQLPGQMYVRIL